MDVKDKNGVIVGDGDVIDIHQTVNGQNLFIVHVQNGEYSVTYLDGRPYEYDVLELLDCTEMFSDESTIEVVDNIHKIKEHDMVVLNESKEEGVVVHVYNENSFEIEHGINYESIITNYRNYICWNLSEITFGSHYFRCSSLRSLGILCLGLQPCKLEWV